MNIEDGTELVDRIKDTVHEQYFEIKRLRELEKEHQKINGELRKENKELNNIIKEIREYINKNEIVEVYLDCKLYETQIYKDILDILNKGKGEWKGE